MTRRLEYVSYHLQSALQRRTALHVKIVVTFMSLLALCSLTLVEAAPRITFDKESLDYVRVLYGDTV